MGYGLGNGQWVRVGLWKMGYGQWASGFFDQISMYARMCVFGFQSQGMIVIK